MNSVGRMKRINGTVIMAGKRAAFSSARIMRSFRNSADNTRKADVGEVKPAGGTQRKDTKTDNRYRDSYLVENKAVSDVGVD